MTLKDLFNFEKIKQHYYFANTPNYLFKKLREEQTVEEFAKNNNVENLVKIFNDYLKENRLEVDDLIFMYVIIVALTFKSKQDVTKFFEKLDDYQIEWFKEFKNIYLNSFIPTEYLSFDMNEK